MNDELAYAMHRLSVHKTRVRYISEAEYGADVNLVVAALERAMPLLPLVDVIEKLEAVPEWSIKLQKFKLLGGIVGHLEIGPNKRLVAEDTWPEAIRALAQAVEPAPRRGRGECLEQG